MQNKPKAELTAALMLLDIRSMSFDMREIDNRRFMFSPQTGELILGRQYRGGQLYKSHAEEHFDSGAKAPFDSFIRGWIGTGRDYPDGVIHFAPNIGTDNITAFDNAFSTLQMFSENGAAGDIAPLPSQTDEPCFDRIGLYMCVAATPVPWNDPKSSHTG